MREQKWVHVYVFFLPFLIGLPLIAMYFKWVEARYYAINFFLELDKLLEVSLLPPLGIYGLTGFVVFCTLAWLKSDFKWLTGLKRFRALILPLALCALIWYLKQPILNKYKEPTNQTQQSFSLKLSTEKV